MREQHAAAEAITWNLLTGPTFWDFWLGLAVGLCHVSAVPHLAAAFGSTGEFESDPNARSKSALRLLLTVARLGTEHPTTRAALSRMNQGHRHVRLTRDDVRYGLAVVAEYPMWWAERFGRRPWSDIEVAATIAFYTRLGHHMGLRDLPGDRAGLQRLIEDYEQEHQDFSTTGARLVSAQLTDVVGGNKLLQTLGRVGLASALGDRTRVAVGLPVLGPATAMIARTSLRLLSRIMSRRTPSLPSLDDRTVLTESTAAAPVPA
ncbi:DUF2236 domain-containing protein [Kutzneria kofuensis]|uniref:ER-bound oxygenase mpaB/mpaB'/Rubber oxygenase catalytic domain-containing protein n=1 Tax=Kutzneria kofuensis TaxID=103725 RepID=A0A7W9KMW8_9PSEU|nr:DUF2236 domain-containing protein [Kutzneria kofuensis]MBB5895500.1 hypothetical protein [Kutzneria kofuensis]